MNDGHRREELARAFTGQRPRLVSLAYRLTGSVAPTFAMRWLLPRLPALRRRHPSPPSTRFSRFRARTIRPSAAAAPRPAATTSSTASTD